MFYINGDRAVKGDIIHLDLNDSDYYALLLKFCVLLSHNYAIDALDAFNTFQKKLRGFLEKLGFFTLTNLELEKFEGQHAVMMSSSQRGIFKMEFINKTKFYRTYFNDIYAEEVVKDSEYVYLMVNVDSSLIKIGTSIKPFYREKTLHSQEPSIHLIAKWCCGKEIEKILHAKYANNRVRGEWFRLTLTDLSEIEEYMKDVS